jgi:NAD(P)-dependent dehydrogenase (short-subunit alcohol dehydrogenase family)
MDLHITGKTALVTASSSGIGLATATAIASAATNGAAVRVEGGSIPTVL